MPTNSLNALLFLGFVSIVVFVKEITPTGFKVWTQKRLEEGPLYGKMEFPGGKIELGESPLEAALREVDEEVGSRVGLSLRQSNGLKLFKIQHYKTETKKITLYVHVVFEPIQGLDNVTFENQWYEIGYQQKSQPLFGLIPEINHVFLDELAIYIQTEYLVKPAT